MSETSKKRFQLTEDYLAIIIGFILIAIAAVSVVTGAFSFTPLSFSTWGPGSGAALTDQFTSTFAARLLLTYVVLAIFFTIGAVLQGERASRFLPAFTVVFVVGILVRLISSEYTANRYLEWAFWALVVGLVVANTVGVPEWLRPAVRTEYYIKTGLVVMGFSVLFSNIVNFGLYGLAIAWFVTPVVIIFMWWFGVHVLKMENKPLVITIATATSVCGTSAAIATAAAAKARKQDLSLAVSVSIIFTIIMMVFEPKIIQWVGLGELMGGALIGGTVDSTGAVTVAGTALGELGQTSAVLVKSIQNILIGFIAFAVAIFFATRVEQGDRADVEVGPKEIWTRVPKFILGFFAASLIASFVFVPLVGNDTVAAINKVLDQYKNWAFVLAFTSIGLDTNFRSISKQMSGGKPLILYVVGQLFNIFLTFVVVYIALSGRFFPLPNIAL